MAGGEPLPEPPPPEPPPPHDAIIRAAASESARTMRTPTPPNLSQHINRGRRISVKHGDEPASAHTPLSGGPAPRRPPAFCSRRSQETPPGHGSFRRVAALRRAATARPLLAQ